MIEQLNKIKLSLRRRSLDAVLITQPENRRYLSGFTARDHSISESSGVLLILADDRPYLLTDSRYQSQAEDEADKFKVKLYPRGLFVLLAKLLTSLKVKRLGFESHYFLHATSLTLKKLTDKKGIELLPVTGLVEKLRVRKTDGELQKIKKAVHLNEEVFREVYKEIDRGQTEREVAWKIERVMQLKGADRLSFETIVASGPNGALPHAVPTDRVLQTGEPIVIDMGLTLDGYCSDMTRTIVLGRADQRTAGLFKLVRKAQLIGIKSLKSGMTGQEVDRLARNVIIQAGLGDLFCHGLGHGVGLAVHEEPALNWRNRKQLQAGMVVTIEPGIYIPGWGGIRLENMAVVLESGCEVINQDTTFLDNF